MSITIKHNEAPNLKMPKFSVDGKLHDKLDSYDVTSLMNRSNFTCFLGRAGSGKTSLLTGFLKTPELFKRVYTKIYVFMPPGSRASMKDSFFDKYVHPSQIYDELTYMNLQEVYEACQENADDDDNSLIIFDDVQKSFRDNSIRKLLLSMINNRRHARLSMWMACQNYKSIEPQVRAGLTDMFIFKINKREMECIFEEQVEQHKEMFLEILKHVFKEPHDFMYINTGTQRIFSNFDEIIIPEDD